MTSQTQTLLSADHWRMFTCTAKKKKKIRTNELQYKNVTNHLTALLLFQCIVELTVQILTDTISDHDAGTASECHL